MIITNNDHWLIMIITDDLYLLYYHHYDIATDGKHPIYQFFNDHILVQAL